MIKITYVVFILMNGYWQPIQNSPEFAVVEDCFKYVEKLNKFVIHVCGSKDGS